MTTPCSRCPLRRCAAFIPMQPDELAFMQAAKIGEMTVAPGATILMEGEPSMRLFTALRGIGLRHKTLEDGRRQVLNFIFPGDFIGLQAMLIDEMRHTVVTSTEMTLCIFDKRTFWKMYETQAERAFSLTWIAAVEEHFLGDALASIGQRDATERVAWALLRIHGRLVSLDLEREGRVPLPFRQQDLADALGLSLVHTNKTLARLRREGLAHWSDGLLHLPDPDRLAAVALMDEPVSAQRPLF